MALQPGTPAPDFTLKTKTAEGLADVTLSAHFGHKNTVLLFVPAAFTGVCTQEMCDITAGLGNWTGANAEVYGISGDSPFAQEAWAQANGIKVTLLSDYAHKVAVAYDVLLEDFIGLGPGNKRAVFVIDKAGVVRYSEVTPTPGDMPDLAAARGALSQLG